MRRLHALIVACFVLASCASTPEVPPGIDIAEGLEIEVAATGFVGPTQLDVVGDGRFVLGELAGAERDATGRVLLLDDQFRIEAILLDGLDKPTGVVAGNEFVFVQDRSGVLRVPVDGTEPATELVGRLPDNGRSQGSLSLSGDGHLFFASSGAKRGAERTEDSGTLWVLENATAQEPAVAEPFATGFKHAYAHAEVGGGSVFSVEMSDGTFDGERAPDELVQVARGDDAGWPFCIGDNLPVVEFGGTEDRCDESPASHALFSPGATPTAIALAPWDRSLLLVALWIPGEIVAIPVEAPSDGPYVPEVVVSGIANPQSLVVDGDRVLIVDHDSGSIFSLSAS